MIQSAHSSSSPPFLRRGCCKKAQRFYSWGGKLQRSFDLTPVRTNGLARQALEMLGAASTHNPCHPCHPLKIRDSDNKALIRPHLSFGEAGRAHTSATHNPCHPCHPIKIRDSDNKALIRPHLSFGEAVESPRICNPQSVSSAPSLKNP
jgi:hypothetical protein